MKTILVIGSSGFLGSNVVDYLKKKYKVIAAFHKNVIRIPGISTFYYNLNNKDYMKRVLSLTKPEYIIYCAGVTDFLTCAKSPRVAEIVNSFGPVLLSTSADTVPHRFIYLSTSYVYDGVKGNFSEHDVVLPETTYGKSKLAGENYVRSKSLTYTILRFAPIYGIGSSFHPSEFDRIRMKLERGQTVELPENEVHSFLSMDIVLKAIDWVIQNETKNKTYNLGGLTKISWHEFGTQIANTLGFNPTQVVPVKAQFEGDKDFSLNGSELVRMLEVDPLVVEEGLDLLKKKLVLGLPPGLS